MGARMMRNVLLLTLAGVVCTALGVTGPDDSVAVDDASADELAKQLLEAKNQVAEAKDRVSKAVDAVASATAEAKASKAQAEDATKEAEAAKTHTMERMEEAKKAVEEASTEAQQNDLKKEEEMKQLEIEMQADEKQCGDRVTKWQEKAMNFKNELETLRARVAELEAQQEPSTAAADA